ncbi:MAG: type II toxin-antitoxin system VapC family toxin [Phycisphaerae bacterium]|nr:type II toxin-antitoxin system VapC family toxin [Phycisphaerae bacterium]
MLNLDTHILLHALTGSLTRREKKLLCGNPWGISAIVLWEIAKLAQLGRIEIDLDSPRLRRVIARLRIWPLDLPICREIANLDFKGDPADEIIAATSIVQRVPLITRDRAIKKSKRVPLA